MKRLILTLTTLISIIGFSQGQLKPVKGKVINEAKFYVSKDTANYIELFSANTILNLTGVDEEFFRILALGNRHGFVKKNKIKDADSLSRLLVADLKEIKNYQKIRDSIKRVVSDNEKKGKYKNSVIDKISGDVVPADTKNSHSQTKDKTFTPTNRNNPSNRASSVCGHKNKSGGYCKRTVVNGGYCWQHS
jgi:hypothetical protein